MKFRKECLAILLPTSSPSCITIHLNGDMEFVKEPNSWFAYQNLHICSKDEINAGDWYVMFDGYNCSGNAKVYKCLSVTRDNINNTDSIGYSKSQCRKIIATTDLNLKESLEMIGTGSTYLFDLPKISESFLNTYVNKYNKGKKIHKVMVEYETAHHIGLSADPYHGRDNWICVGSEAACFLYERPLLYIDGIVIYECKETWTREEAHQLRIDSFFAAIDSWKHHGNKFNRSFTPVDMLNEYIEKNPLG